MELLTRQTFIKIITTCLTVWILQACTHTQPEYNKALFQGYFNDYQQTSGKVVGTYVSAQTLKSESDAEMFPAKSLTHLMFSFVNLCGPGQVQKVDEICREKADFTLATNSNSLDALTAPLLAKIKQKNPKLKVIASLGGGMGSKPFFPLAKSKKTRAIFINSSINYLKQHQVFDGLDVDWEHPRTFEQGQQYLALMKELRAELDKLELQTNRQYQLTTAVAGSEWAVKHIPYNQVSQYFDYIFAMTYDGAGPWAPRIGHHTSLYSATHQPHSLDTSIRNLINAGVPTNKLVAGAASYSRGWTKIKNTQNNNPFTGEGEYVTSKQFGGIQYKHSINNNLDTSSGQGKTASKLYMMTSWVPFIYGKRRHNR